jgi:branched-chain amino acid transport system substrate-binding protein
MDKKKQVVSTEQEPQSCGTTRRQFMQISAAALAAGVLLGKTTRSFAAAKTIKIGYVSPQTGNLAAFGESDNFVVAQARKAVGSGITINGTSYPVQFVVRDSQSNPNRAGEVAAQLIKSDKVDFMISAGTPDTVNPVADQCELNGTPNLSSDAPWQAWYFGRGGKPGKGFQWTHHFCWGIEDLIAAYTDMWKQASTNKIVGGAWSNDVEGNTFRDEKLGFPGGFKAQGFKVIDPGGFQYTTQDFSAIISGLKRDRAEIFNPNMPLPTFSTFWSQALQQGYHPKIATIGKALLFPASLDALGAKARNLTCETWWHPTYPFKSGMTGQTAQQICDEWERTTHKQWTQPIGLRHALFEVAVNVLKRLKNPNDPKSYVEAIRATNYDSVAGHIQFSGSLSPNPNVCRTAVTTGQWVPGKKWKWDLVVVASGFYKQCKPQAKMNYMSY